MLIGESGSGRRTMKPCHRDNLIQSPLPARLSNQCSQSGVNKCIPKVDFTIHFKLTLKKYIYLFDADGF